jgi:hypothetical protein
MELSVQVGFSLDNYNYTANLSLPDTAPTPEAPFVFRVTRSPAASSGSPSGASDGSASTAAAATAPALLTVAVGGTDAVYLAVSPPTDVIDNVASGLVNELSVIVAEGNFNGAKFTTAPAIAASTDTSGGASGGASGTSGNP